MSEFFNGVERRRSFDFSVIKRTLTAWGAMSSLPGIAEGIVDDVTPLPETGMNYGERQVNKQRRALHDILTRDEYLRRSVEADEIAFGLAEAIRYVGGEKGEDSAEYAALVTLLQVYRIEKNLAPKPDDVIDPRRIAFRVLNPVTIHQPDDRA